MPRGVGDIVVRRSKVCGEIDDKFSMHDKIVIRLFKVSCEHFCSHIVTSLFRLWLIELGELTIPTNIKVHDWADAHIDDP